MPVALQPEIGHVGTGAVGQLGDVAVAVVVVEPVGPVVGAALDQDRRGYLRGPRPRRESVGVVAFPAPCAAVVGFDGLADAAAKGIIGVAVFGQAAVIS